MSWNRRSIATKRHSHRVHRLGLESLESRCLLAGLEVTALMPNNSGFIAEFSDEFDVERLNVHASDRPGGETVDVVLLGRDTGLVAGSLVVGSDNHSITFIKSGGPLLPDSYSLTLRSGSGGFSDLGGALLDGDGDGVPGDDFEMSFDVSRSVEAVTLSIPDVVRGPGQSLNSPPTSAGIPIVIDAGIDVRTVSLALRFDPLLVAIAGAVPGVDMPAGSTVQFDRPNAGKVTLQITSPIGLTPEGLRAVELTVIVPPTETRYADSGILDLHDIVVLDDEDNEIAWVDDDAIHVSAFLGDASSNARINAGDASELARVAALIESGFDGFPTVEPSIIGDVTRNLRVNASDASKVAQFAALIPVDEIPAVPAQAALTEIESVSPGNGEDLVSVTRETIVRFDRRIDARTIPADGGNSLYLIANGERVPGRAVVSSTERFATFYYDTPLPASTEVRVVVDGNSLHDGQGIPIDANGDGEPGGIRVSDFRTLPLTRIAGTNAFGFVRDSLTGHPLVGATIRVDAFPDANAVTDENGRFELVDMPAPEFFVHIDGSTATHLNVDGNLVALDSGISYPSVGKPFHSVPGETTQLFMPGQLVLAGEDAEPFDVFLPSQAIDDAQLLSPTETTAVGFGPSALAQLQQMFPGTDSSMFEAMQVEFAPGSAIDEQGIAATEAVLIPVSPDRIPAPLPPNLSPELVVSIQAGQATNFDVPAAVTFPNLEGLNPGARTLVLSFDHDAGKWQTVGTATVDDEARTIVSDSAVIRAPGWHLVDPGVQGAADAVEAEDDLPVACVVPNSYCRLLDEEYPDPRIQASLLANNATIQGIPDPRDGENWARHDEYSITIPPGRTTGAGETPLEFLARWPQSMGDVPIGSAKDDFDGLATFAKFDSPPPVGTIIHADAAESEYLPGAWFRNDVMLTEQEETHFRFSTLTTPRAGQHVFFGSREFGAEQNKDGSWTLYTRAIDRANTESNLLASTYYDVQDRIWLSFFRGVGQQFGMSEQESRSAAKKSRSGVIRDQPEDLEGNVKRRTHGSSLTKAEDYYYRVEFRASIDRELTVINGTTRSDGTVSLTLPDTSGYTVHFWSPVSNKYGVLSGVTPETGTEVDLGTALIHARPGFDNDGDGLGSLAELVLGTSDQMNDTDRDGISDAAEIELGLDPLGGRGIPTGVIASLSLQGESNQVVLESSTPVASSEQLAYVATGSHGIAIVDTTEFNNPIILGQLDLDGDATDIAVDSRLGIAALASNAGGLHFVDVSDPMLPSLLRTVDIDSGRLEIVDGVIYAAVGMNLSAYDLLTGELFETLELGGSQLTDVRKEGQILFTMDASRRLRSVDIGDIRLRVLDDVIVPSAGGRLFVGGGIAYATAQSDFRGGFATVNVTNPTELSVISGSDVSSPFIAPRQDVVANGSGLGLLVGTPGTDGVVDVVDLSDPANTNVAETEFVTRFSLPAAPFSASIGAGIGYIAAGTAGLAVVNYSAFDNRGNAPSVSLRPLPDVDDSTPGTQIVEGTRVSLGITVEDDVQVRNVEVVLNGETVLNDVSFPFDSTIAMPALSTAASVSVEIRATDTGGNTSSIVEVIELVADTQPPEIVAILPGDGAARFEGHRNVRIVFSESVDEATVTAQSVTLINQANPANVVEVRDIQVRKQGREVQLSYDPLPLGHFMLSIDTASIKDRAGNPVGGDAIITEFRVIADVDPGETLGTALDVGTLDGFFQHQEAIGEDGIGQDDPVDVYKFSVGVPSSVRAELTDRNEGARIFLLADLNGNGSFDSGETFSSDASGFASDLAVADELLPGVYYLWIDRTSAGQSTPYTLTLTTSPITSVNLANDPGATLETARDLGVLGATLVVTDMVMYGVDPVDVYKFSVGVPSSVRAELTDRNEGARIFLLADLNGNGSFDSGETFSSDASGFASDLAVADELLPGVYYIWIDQRSAGQSTPYTLTLTTSPITSVNLANDPGATLETARDLGVLGATLVVTDMVMYGVDPVDVYKFSVGVPSSVRAELTDRNEGARIFLLADLNGNGSFDSGETFSSDASGFASDLAVADELLPGVYYIWIDQRSAGQSTPYTLTLTTSPIE